MSGKVLLVDDEPQVRATIKAMLDASELDIELTGVGDAEECVAALEHTRFNLILMDVNLPGMDGWDTIQTLVNRNLLHGALVSMMTGNLDPDARMQNLKPHLLNFLRKPFNAKELVAVVEAGLVMSGENESP